MGKDLKGKELGEGISQRADGLYMARFVDRFNKRKQKKSKKLQVVRQWLADASYIDQHSDLDQAADMMVDAWYEYWIGIKMQTVRPNTVRNYRERYEHNIKEVIGKKLLTEVKPIHCQKIFSNMAEKGYKTSTIYQARITLYNMLEFAKESDVILSNPCKKSVRSDMGKPSKKKEALTIDVQKKFLDAVVGYSYENQYRFVLQTGLRTGELIGLKWSDIDFDNRTMKIERSMEYRYKVGEWRVGPPKSQAGYRTIPLTNEAIRILEDQRSKNSRLNIISMEWKDTVFLCRKGTPVKNSTYDTGLFKYCDRIGIPRFSMHVLRHTFATRCIEGGMKPKTLQKILGHSNIGITMNLYVHITEGEKQREIDLVSDSLNVG
ncbi:MAG: tyrosine-type recombinase/integrase [[Clostridium] aminophilum]|uniref:tyrosine-type recombinase/integrase n=1 Tax=[Clostridium] aminophilum TaxID=1526 RepID=UPI0026EA78B7|nr:site-specific integrase [[Clostridium] aminophilum]MDD6195977.1 tyrosine-type recombinase/integrase [[Clostridium] aminophilum]